MNTFHTDESTKFTIMANIAMVDCRKLAVGEVAWHGIRVSDFLFCFCFTWTG